MDPVFFIKSTKIGVFYRYGYTDITTFRDPWTLMSLLHAEGYGGPSTSLLTLSPGSTLQLLPLCKENCDCAPHLRHLERQAATVTLPLQGKVVLSSALILGAIPVLGRQSPSKLRARSKKTVRKSTPTKVGEKVSSCNYVTSTLSLVFINGRSQVACRFCGKSIAKSGHARHVRDMHGVKQKFMCEPPCPYVCKRADHLKKHQKTDICVRGSLKRSVKLVAK